MFPNVRALSIMFMICIASQFSTALPQNRILRSLYSANSVDTSGNMESYLVPGYASGMDKRVPLSLGKKYDRNCFFSPVQCMLSFNNPANQHDDAIWNSRGRR
ncbi:hypothetical protein L596_005159 [Steinernema carpocapsae]|uniref:Uncharacterized protein n=1 Tax=Steinernema carpocapsae TaxID=34508 RepID=A0A4U8UY23_STECR|nr:hypothetical protein L596_005159 [Steinernema carpocapsae]